MIRRADLDDAKKILHIETQCFTSDRLSARSIRHFLRSDRNRLFLYMSDGVAAGYILTLSHARHRLARHYSVAVLPEYRKRGVAEALLLHAEQDFGEKDGFTLEIRKDNHSAQRLYSRMGYTARRTMNNYYDDGQDGIEMVKLK
jgi:ribosomal protein S18 acetylase RimI-like enzyme